MNDAEAFIYFKPDKQQYAILSVNNNNRTLLKEQQTDKRFVVKQVTGFNLYIRQLFRKSFIEPIVRLIITFCPSILPPIRT